MRTNTYKPGVWSVICDRCGFSFNSDEVKKTWDGLYVCEADFETRHVADFIKAPKPIRPLPFTRPEPADTFITVDYIATSVGQQDTTIPEVTPGIEGDL